jgi:antibiotic biosynthesis monooxygenase (ABM) superfamily enzyme
VIGYPQNPGNSRLALRSLQRDHLFCGYEWQAFCIGFQGMTTIHKGNRPVTLINVFRVNPKYQGRLVELLEEATEEVMQRVPGFVSANIHRSLDGKRVVNYAQWETVEAFKEMPSFPGTKAHMVKAAWLSRMRFQPSLYEVVSTHVLDGSVE